MNFRLIMNTCVSELLWKIWGINVFLFALCGNPQICISNYLCINIEKYKENSKKVVQVTMSCLWVAIYLLTYK